MSVQAQEVAGVEVEALVQRGKLMIELAQADLEAAEQSEGAFSPGARLRRETLNEALRAWERLRAEFGSRRIQAALKLPPRVVVDVPTADESSSTRVILIPIGGLAYRAESVPGTPLAPRQWKLSRLRPPLTDGPYYACKLRDGTLQCDCAGWTYHDAPHPQTPSCKHLRALRTLNLL